MNNESIEFDIKVNGKDAEANIKDVEKAQEDLSKSSDKTTKNIKTNWTAIGAAAATAAVALGAMMKQSIELERALFGLNTETKEWIRNASEQYGMSQNMIAGFVQTGKAAGMAGEDISTMIDQAVALGRAYPHESTESFIDNLVMLNRTGEAQGYVVDILEQKYGQINLKTLSLTQKQEALEEATRGVNDEFNKTAAADYDRVMQELSNTSSDLGYSLLQLAEESGILWTLNKIMDAGSLAATGYAIALNRVAYGVKSLAGADTSGLDEAYAKLVKLSEKKQDDILGIGGDENVVDLGTIAVTGKALPSSVAATGGTSSSEADKERAIALAANERFWDEYNRTIMTATEYELTKLNERYVEYAKHIDDKVALEEWFATEQQRIMDETNEIALHYQDMQMSVTDNMTRAMIDFTRTGKANFKEMANSIIQDLVAIQIRASMSNLMGGFSGAGGASSGIFGAIGSMLFNAQGNAFNNGKVTPFASGGVVSSPTAFPMSDGVGVMGEAGAEAIMPLTRSSDGDLGVKSVAPVINVNVENFGSNEVQVSQSDDTISIVIAEIAGSINRGTSKIGDAIENRYGIRKV